MENTTLFDVATLKRANIKVTLQEVCKSLKEKGYDPMKQLTGYLLSGDPGYISSYQNAREKITNLERAEIIVYLLEEGMKCDSSV